LFPGPDFTHSGNSKNSLKVLVPQAFLFRFYPLRGRKTASLPFFAFRFLLRKNPGNLFTPASLPATQFCVGERLLPYFLK
jgi:hypothetical protein